MVVSETQLVSSESMMISELHGGLCEDGDLEVPFSVAIMISVPTVVSEPQVVSVAQVVSGQPGL